MKKILLISLVVLSVMCSADVLTDSEEQLIYDVLEKVELDSSSINFLKDWASDTKFKIPIVVDIINNPMKFPELTEEISDKIESKAGLLDYFGKVIFNQEVRISKDKILKKINKAETINDVFDYVEFVWNKAKIHQIETWENLSAEEISMLEYFALTAHQESQDSLQYNQYISDNSILEYSETEIEEYIKIFEKINFGSMIICAQTMQAGFDILTKNHKKIYDIVGEKKEMNLRDTGFGTFVIGTSGTDHYQEDYSFILDIGGDDVYSGNLNANFENPFYWVLDVSGDDKYAGSELNGLFSANFGCGFSTDLDGDDFYTGDDYSFSSFFGVQISEDFAGDDIYSCGLHSVAASSFGISVLKDFSGNDMYSVTEFGQGFAGTLAAGVLVDFAGNDVYFAGGKYLHKPLAPMDYRSLSQGFGYGMRPDLAGGIGVLYDGEGNDRFDGGVYAQAVAYWYALGILIDKDGNDFYNAVYYPQGSGIHLAGGFLYDEKGEDSYYSKHGPGQGAGHDYGVGFLVDRAGDDNYSIEGGNGLGLTNSVGVFLDVSGNDRYERANDKSYGYANKARDSGGIGIFLDIGGEDFYPKGSYANDSLWVSGTLGVGFDTLLVIPTKPIEELAEEQSTEIDSLAEIEEIFGIASQWEVGSAKKKVKRAREILLSREAEAAKQIAENAMDSKSGLVFRAIKEFAKGSEIFRGMLPELMVNTDSLIAKNTIAVIGELADSTYIPNLESILTDGKYKPAVLSCIGKMKTDKSTEILQEYMNSDSEKIRVITARGFKKIDTKMSRKLLSSMKDDKSFLIKTIVKLVEEKLREE